MGDDWVNVRLTEFGERYLKETGGGSLSVHEGPGAGFVVKPGAVIRVTRAFDWARVLQPHHVNGHATFEIAPEEEQKTAIGEEN